MYYQDILCRIGIRQSAKTYRRLITAKPRPRYRAYHSEPRKMADARPTFPLSQRYTQRKQKQFSRPMTGHTPQKLPFFNAISCIIAVRSADFAYTRSIMIPPKSLFVNKFFGNNHKNFHVFLVITENFIFSFLNLFPAP